MKQEDKQYEKWLAEVKSRQPILDNPEETDSIYPRQDIRNLAPKETEKVSHRSMGIRHCRNIITFIIHQ